VDVEARQHGRGRRGRRGLDLEIEQQQVGVELTPSRDDLAAGCGQHRVAVEHHVVVAADAVHPGQPQVVLRGVAGDPALALGPLARWYGEALQLITTRAPASAAACTGPLSW
jgi:hypothetical protein